MKYKKLITKLLVIKGAVVGGPWEAGFAMEVGFLASLIVKSASLPVLG